MGTRSKAADDAIMKQLREMSSNMLTKVHFDDEMKAIDKKLKEHDEKIKDIDQRLTQVETTPINYADDIYKELYDQEVRKNNIIIFKMPEQNTEGINKSNVLEKEKEAVTNLFADMELIDAVDDRVSMRVYRIGNSTSPKPRPLRVILHHSDIRRQVFNAAKNLKGNTKWKKVSISPDLTKKATKTRKRKTKSFTRRSPKEE